MATQFTIYRSSDASAPVLSGTAGALTTLLDKCLADGYGAKVAAGWTKAFTDGANRRVYRQGSGSAVYFRVRDDAGGTGGAQEALLRGGEVFTDVDTISIGPFPTVAQCALTDNSLVIRKSASANATARSWIVFADSKTCYLFAQTGDTASTYYAVFFGDIYSLTPADAFCGSLIARHIENNATTTYENLPAVYNNIPPASWGAGFGGHFTQRAYTGTGGSAVFDKVGHLFATQIGSGVQSFEGGVTYPNPPDGGLYLNRVYYVDPVTGGAKTLRGWMRGLWMSAHASGSFADGDTVGGTGDLAGRTFICVKLLQTAALTATHCFVETSATIE